MIPEYFDVVNERDEPVSRALRQEVHARGLLHRAVHVLVFDQHGRVFLQKRSMLKDTSPGLWDSSCSGHLDAGEDYDSAAIRELGEELGIIVQTPPTRWFRENGIKPGQQLDLKAVAAALEARGFKPDRFGIRP